eukprot:4468900-Amphidinium_carterae.1
MNVLQLALLWLEFRRLFMTCSLNFSSKPESLPSWSLLNTEGEETLNMLVPSEWVHMRQTPPLLCRPGLGLRMKPCPSLNQISIFQVDGVMGGRWQSKPRAVVPSALTDALGSIRNSALYKAYIWCCCWSHPPCGSFWGRASCLVSCLPESYVAPSLPMVLDIESMGLWNLELAYGHKHGRVHQLCKRQYVDLTDADTIRLVRLSLNECTRSGRALSDPEPHGSGGHFGTSVAIMEQVSQHEGFQKIFTKGTQFILDAQRNAMDAVV